MEKEPLFEGKGTPAQSTSGNSAHKAQGARLDVTTVRKVSGKMTGLILTKHNALMRPDSTGETAVKSIIFSDGEPIFVWGKSTGKAVDRTPTFRIEHNLTFQTPSKGLAYLNTTKGWAEALYNFATGEYDLKVYAVKRGWRGLVPLFHLERRE